MRCHRTDVHLLLHESALERLAEADYWALLQVVIDELVTEGEPQLAAGWSDHARRFAQYGLLAMSVLGGFCWPGAERLICAQTLADAARLITGGEDATLHEQRRGIAYPVFPHPLVSYALLLLVVQRMRVHSSRRGTLAALDPGTCLAPLSPRSTVERPARQHPYRAGLIEEYLHQTAACAEIDPLLALDDYLAAGRRLLLWIYEPDVVYALLGATDTTPPARGED